MGPGQLAAKTKLEKKLELLSKLEWSWSDIGLLVLRVNTALLMVHHGLDKLADADTFANGTVAVYFAFLPGPPLFWTYLSAGIEIVGSACWIAGVLTRPAAALLAGTMVNALAFHLMAFGAQNFPLCPDAACGSYTFEPSLAYLGVATFLALHGPGKFSLKPNGF